MEDWPKYDRKSVTDHCRASTGPMDKLERLYALPRYRTTTTGKAILREE